MSCSRTPPTIEREIRPSPSNGDPPAGCSVSGCRNESAAKSSTTVTTASCSSSSYSCSSSFVVSSVVSGFEMESTYAVNYCGKTTTMHLTWKHTKSPFNFFHILCSAFCYFSSMLDVQTGQVLCRPLALMHEIPVYAIPISQLGLFPARAFVWLPFSIGFVFENQSNIPYTRQVYGSRH